MRSKVVHTHRVLPTMFIILTPSFYLNESLTKWSREDGKIRHPNPSLHPSFPKHPFPSFEVVNIFAPSPQQSIAFVLLLHPSSLHPFVSASFFLFHYPLSTERSKENRMLFNYNVGATWPVISTILAQRSFQFLRIPGFREPGMVLKLDIQRRLKNTTLQRRLHPGMEESFHCFNTVSFISSGISCGLNETFFFFFLRRYRLLLQNEHVYLINFINFQW